MSNQVMPLKLRETLYLSDQQNRLRFDNLLGHEPARMRALPPPFEGWCTLSSDADSPSMEGFISIGIAIREHFALPISDSTFPHFIYNQGLIADGEFEQLFPDFGRGNIFDLETFVTRCGEWLKQVYQGRIDTVHGWLLRQQIRIGDDAVFGILQTKKTRTERLIRRVRKLTGRYCPSLSQELNFRLPQGWHPRVPPRYLVFEYRAIGLQGPVALVFHDNGKVVAKVNLDEITDGAPETLTPYVIDMVAQLGPDADLLKRIQVRVQAKGWPVCVEIRRPMMISWLRSHIEEQKRLFEAFNIRLTTYTSHGGGYNIGHALATDLDSSDTRGMAEIKNNPYYAIDLFREFGIRYINTANNTSRAEPIKLSQFAFPRVINNGELVYDFDRFLLIPRNFKLFGNSQNPSLANFAGWQLEQLMELIDKSPGLETGGAIYTHLLSRCLDDPDRLDRSPEKILNEETRQALLLLARRYYGTSNPGRRIFVAPLANLLRYSTVLRWAPRNSSYDPATNSVHIHGWTDPITGERFPKHPGDSGSDLRYATFYVHDAASAKLFVDGLEYTGLIRNRDDGVHGESITVPPLEKDTPLLGRIAYDNRRDCRLTTLGCHINHCPTGHQITLEADKAEVILEFTNVSLSDHFGVRLILHWDTGDVGYLIDIEDIDGHIWSAAYGISSSNTPAHQILYDTKSTRQDIVVPFYRLTEEGSHDIFPSTALARVRLHLNGTIGQELVVERLSLLRDDPRASSDVCIIGGQADRSLGLRQVRLQYDGGKAVTPVLKSGWFIFMDPVPAGSVVRILGEDTEGRFTTCDLGEEIEITTDTLEITFSVHAVKDVHQ